MKSLVKSKAEVGIWLENVDMPEIGHNDVLVKVRKTAICGTDIHIFNWDDWAQKTIPVPMTVGHEFAGEIVEIGSEVIGFPPKDTLRVDTAANAAPVNDIFAEIQSALALTAPVLLQNL